MNDRDAALDLLEQTRRTYVTQARAAAVQLFLARRRPITVDDVRSVCPPPEDIDGRVMGCVLRYREWIKVGHTNSTRRECHQRPIATFAWVG